MLNRKVAMRLQTSLNERPRTAPHRTALELPGQGKAGALMKLPRGPQQVVVLVSRRRRAVVTLVTWQSASAVSHRTAPWQCGQLWLRLAKDQVRPTQSWCNTPTPRASADLQQQPVLAGRWSRKVGRRQSEDAGSGRAGVEPPPPDSPRCPTSNHLVRQVRQPSFRSWSRPWKTSLPQPSIKK